MRAFTRASRIRGSRIPLQEPDDTAGEAGTCRSGLRALLGSTAAEVVGFLVDHQGPADRTSDTHQAQIVIEAVDTRRAVLPDLDVAEIPDVTQRIARCSVIHLKPAVRRIAILP